MLEVSTIPQVARDLLDSGPTIKQVSIAIGFTSASASFFAWGSHRGTRRALVMLAPAVPAPLSRGMLDEAQFQRRRKNWTIGVTVVFLLFLVACCVSLPIVQHLILKIANWAMAGALVIGAAYAAFHRFSRSLARFYTNIQLGGIEDDGWVDEADRALGNAYWMNKWDYAGWLPDDSDYDNSC